MSKTTIQLDESTKDRLDELKRADGESYESVLLMLIASHNNRQEAEDEPDKDRIREIARAEIRDLVIGEALT